MPQPFNNWYDKNPFKGIQNPTIGQELKSFRASAHIFARQQFPKAFATGAIGAGVFAPTAKEAFANPWRRRLETHDPRYRQNLEKLSKLHPDNKKIGKLMQEYDNLSPSDISNRKFKGKIGRLGQGVALTVGLALLSDGGAVGKGRAVISGMASDLGAAIGSLLGPAGAMVGGLIGYHASESIMKRTDKIVDKERNKRKLSWGAHTAPFRNERAHTMRQQSLQLMNRGEMSARSLLGQEAVFVHK